MTEDPRYEHISDVEAALPPDGLLDSLLFSFALNRRRSSFVVVAEWPVRIVGAQRSFIEMTFVGVTRFARLTGHRAELRRYDEKYVLRPGERAFMLQWIVLVGANCRLDIGYEFGGVELEYQSVSAQVLHARVRQLSEKRWEYRNVRNDRVVDFGDPFGHAATAN